MKARIASVIVAVAGGATWPAFAQDVAGGKAVFESRCVGCHSLERNRVGPALGTVIGRKAGTNPEFNYSDALRNAGHVWDAAKLETWLVNPQAFVPGALMPFRLGDAKERKDVAAYLASLRK